MEEIGNDSATNVTSNKEIISDSSSVISKDNQINDNNNILNEKEDILAKKISEYKPEEITLNKKIIIDSINIYNTISTNYGDKKLDITRFSQEEQDKALLATDIFLLNGKKISHIDDLDKYTNLKELYLNQNYISEIKGLDNLKNLQVLNLSYNNISNIKVLEKVNFKELKVLNLIYNSINEKDNSLILSKLKSKIPDFSY